MSTINQVTWLNEIAIKIVIHVWIIFMKIDWLIDCFTARTSQKGY